MLGLERIMDAVRLEEKYNRELQEMIDETQAGIDSTTNELTELQRLLAQKTRQVATVTDDFVRQQPWSAMALAVGAGCLLGFLLSRK